MSNELKLVPTEPTEAMLDRAVAFALNVQLGGDYSWSQYMRDLWATMLAGAISDAQAPIGEVVDFRETAFASIPVIAWESKPELGAKLYAAPVATAAAAPSDETNSEFLARKYRESQPDERAAFEAQWNYFLESGQHESDAYLMGWKVWQCARATAPQATGPIYQIGANAGGGIAWWDVDKDRYEREKKAGYMKTCVVYREK